VLATLSTGQTVTAILAAVAVAGLLLTAINVVLAVTNERKRTQPIVVAHEDGPRSFAERAGFFAVSSYVTNEANGHAFNVRFGVEIRGVRYPQRMELADPSSGNVQRVLRPGERRPEIGSWEIVMPQASVVGSNGGDVDAGRAYWARYSNAYGKTWETRNPSDRTARLDVRRVRFVRLHEWREKRARDGAAKDGRAWEQRAIAALLDRAPSAEEPQRDEPAPTG